MRSEMKVLLPSSGAGEVPGQPGIRGGLQPWQRYLAEMIGTFALVFAGCGAVITNQVVPGSVSPVGIALVFGAVVGVMIYALGPISAAHFNPAVTLGFAVAGRFPWRHVPAYFASQIAGGVLASSLHRLLYAPDAAQAVAYGSTLPRIGWGAALGFEVILTLFLMLVIMAVATDARTPPSVPGIAIGGTVGLCALVGGPLCGASMNPARSLAPALVAGGESIRIYWIYLVGPVTGAVLASWLFEALRDGSEHACSAPGDLDAAMREVPATSRAHRS
jgi:MIP family channel proteins